MQKGDQAIKRGGSHITGADGNGWDLRSDTVKLDQHIGHQ
jgi:hypothetical protein